MSQSRLAAARLPPCTAAFSVRVFAASTLSAASVTAWYFLATGISSLKVTGRVAVAPLACPDTVIVGPVIGLVSTNWQTNAYRPDPTLRLIGVVVPGPICSSSAYTAPLAGLVRSTSAPESPELRIWKVCQPGCARCQWPPHEPVFMETTSAALPLLPVLAVPPHPVSATVAASAAAAVSKPVLRMTKSA